MYSYKPDSSQYFPPAIDPDLDLFRASIDCSQHTPLCKYEK